MKKKRMTHFLLIGLNTTWTLFQSSHFLALCANTKKIDESLSLAFCRHTQLPLKSSVIITRHHQREELGEVKRATCNEQIEFEKASVLKKTTLVHKRNKASHCLLSSQNVIQ